MTTTNSVIIMAITDPNSVILKASHVCSATHNSQDGDKIIFSATALVIFQITFQTRFYRSLVIKITFGEDEEMTDE